MNSKVTIKCLRERSSLTQKNIADYLGMSLANYNKKENCSVKFSLAEAKALADLFGTSIEDIFFDHKVSKSESFDSIIPRKDGEINVTKPHESCR